MKKVLAFSGSNNSSSINRTLVGLAVRHLQNVEDVPLLLSELHLPLYSLDLEEQEGFPEGAEQLKSILESVDGIILSSPEHNGSIPAALKNAIDWLSRMQKPILLDKPILLMSTSPGQNGASTNLEALSKLMPWWGGKLTGTYSLGSFHEHYLADQDTLSDEEDAKLKQAIMTFEAAL
ncbi:MAG: NAD(P)H-dependent oxidoreductase [Bdellovibrionales bacterium]|nr:NAD(P)H-dependent oxidoreductase [Bdellovibrionales bacterium]